MLYYGQFKFGETEGTQQASDMRQMNAPTAWVLTQGPDCTSVS